MKKQGIERLKVEEDDDDEDAGQNGAEPLLDPGLMMCLLLLMF